MVGLLAKVTSLRGGYVLHAVIHPAIACGIILEWVMDTQGSIIGWVGIWKRFYRDARSRLDRRKRRRPGGQAGTTANVRSSPPLEAKVVETAEYDEYNQDMHESHVIPPDARDFSQERVGKGAYEHLDNLSGRSAEKTRSPASCAYVVHPLVAPPRSL